MSIPALFQPLKVGTMNLAHRVVMAPMTRYRADDAHVPTDMITEFYKQRASVPGTLLITEGTFISGQASGQPNAPGVWTDAQIAAWKKVTDAVHVQGSFIYLQLWALGRAARPPLFNKEFPDYPYVSASDIGLKEFPDWKPRPLTIPEIKEYVDWYGQAAKDAVERAGFDGVELHGANGYLPDQFLQDVSNTRTDAYGGSVANRARFVLEAMDAVVAAVGQERAALRLSPWSLYQDMRMADPVPQFAYVVERLKERFPALAYLHLADLGAAGMQGPEDPAQANFVYDLWAPRPLITTGGYDRAKGIETAEKTGQIVGYARAFLANPDLPFRLKEDVPLNPPDYGSFYTAKSAEGYTTYPFSEQFLKTKA
ncbi:NADH:flavin oxidoreductase/NADH oxidase [Epithele typhae]|uniref:NADH:flavin oxidoreductase/NADH oxidase n=1 Tax=Epithele typhae TaxID=378194 RepID=UPI002007339F|nr:NADH:flavin oxidoreductase/NADH oxidase [Epithele typhae]KAH9942507.1 NADH:flavin oxidoreductase/NADH oxidase [Epithele typhae]